MARRPGPSLSRAELAAAGMRVIARVEPKDFTLAAVAGELGVKPPSLYHHVRNSEALREVVAVAGWSALLQSLPEMGGSREASARAFARAYREFAKANPSLYQLMAETSFRPDDAELLEVARLGEGLLRSLELPLTDAVHALRGLRGALHGFVQLELVGQFQLSVPAEQSFEWLITVLLAGLPREHAPA